MRHPRNPNQITIYLVDDDLSFQRAMVGALEAAPDMALLAIAGSRTEGMMLMDAPPVDVLIVDLGLPDGSGIDIIAAAHERWPTCTIMVSTTFGDELHVMQSLMAGAAGYLLKDSAPPSMLNEIRTLHAGGSPISPLIARKILLRFRDGYQPEEEAPAASAQTSRNSLSLREREVLEYITKGFTTVEIAALMSVSHHTVSTFVRRIYAKLEVNSKAEAIYEANARGLLAR